MKRHFPAFLAASNASMAPPGAKTRDVSFVLDPVDLPEIHVIGPEPLQREVELFFGPLRVRSVALVVRNTR